MNTTKLIRDLSQCVTEEAVKATLLRHAGFKAYIREKVDLYVQSDDGVMGTLCEFKYDVKLNRSWPKVLAQALVYVHRISHGELMLPMPSHVALIDKDEAMLFPVTAPVMALIGGDYSWDTAASSPCKKLVQALHELKDLPRTTYALDTDAGCAELVRDIKMPPTADVVGTQVRRKVVSADNFDYVFSEWCKTIGESITATSKGPYFLADMREDAVFNPKTGKLAFMFCNETYQVPPTRYTGFWDMYGRPPAADVQELIMQRLHMFAPEKKRQAEGAFYTPRWVAEKALEYLDLEYPGWREDPNTYVYDCCCGTGNLLAPLTDYSRVFMSTLDVNEILLLKSMDLFPGAELFQFDFLNQDYDELPQRLRDIAEDPSKRLIVLMNPPYAESTTDRTGQRQKPGTSASKVNTAMQSVKLGKAARDLFLQFLYRTNAWFPRSVIGVFSKLKYIVAPSCKRFRETAWSTREFRRGFMFPGTVFPGVKGKFPIGYLIWDNGKLAQEAKLDVIDQKSQVVGTKTFTSCDDYLNSWFVRTVFNGAAQVPVTGALTVFQGSVRHRRTAPALFLGSAVLPGNDPQQSGLMNFLSGLSPAASCVLVTPSTFTQAMVQVAVRKSIKPTWINDRDQFLVPRCDRATYKANLQPGTTNLDPVFICDCVVYNLFSGHNQTSAWEPEYNGQRYRLDNQFYPFSKADASAWLSTDLTRTRQIRAADETFTSSWLQKQQPSPEAADVLAKAKALYSVYYSRLPELMQAKYHLQAWNVGFYQIRMALQEAGIGQNEYAALKASVKTLQQKIATAVYTLGFLE